MAADVEILVRTKEQSVGVIQTAAARVHEDIHELAGLPVVSQDTVSLGTVDI